MQTIYKKGVFTIKYYIGTSNELLPRRYILVRVDFAYVFHGYFLARRELFSCPGASKNPNNKDW